MWISYSTEYCPLLIFMWFSCYTEYFPLLTFMWFSCYSVFCPLLNSHAVFSLLSHIPTLLALDVFGMLKETALAQLREAMPSIRINKFPFSSIGRPTTGNRRTSIWGLRVRDTCLWMHGKCKDDRGIYDRVGVMQ